MLPALCAARAVAQIIPFTQEAIPRGVVYQMQNYPQTAGLQGFGCGFADLDNDRDPDIIILGNAANTVGLFENDGTGHFISRGSVSGIPVLNEASGFAAADYDDDGLIDLYFTQMGLANVLMRNTGGYHFVNVTTAAGVGDDGPGTGACWGDYDGDGRLDLYVCNYNCAVPGSCLKSNKLYRNAGNGTFQDVSAAKGVDDSGFGFQAVWFDYDRDGDVDLYLSNDRGHLPPYFKANRLWRNDFGHMTDVSASSGAGVALYSMGLACGDFDGNGWPDIYVTNVPGYAEGANRLLLNQGNGTFVESQIEAGVDYHRTTSWSAIFFDFDNDGRQDLYVNNQFSANQLHWNQGGFPCTEVSVPFNVTGNSGISYSSAAADVDNDGDMDLLVNNLSNNVELFINHQGESHRWLKFDVVGIAPNHHGVGANVDVRVGKTHYWREVLAGGNGYLGQNEIVLHVGMNDALLADEVTVKWPGGQIIRTLTNLPTNQRWTLYPPQRLGDADGNGVVNLPDFVVFAGCFADGFGPGCEMMDFDGNSVIDMGDFNGFLAKFNGTPPDCDRDGVVDMQQILENPKLDANNNGVLDACDGVPGDATGDGLVNVDDLLVVINSWGICPAPCPADLVPNGVVNVDDLLTVILNWG